VAEVAQRVIVLEDAVVGVVTAAGTSTSVISARESHRPTAALPAVRCSWSTRSIVGDACEADRAG
jgi:hypothetical protein